MAGQPADADPAREPGANRYDDSVSSNDAGALARGVDYGKRALDWFQSLAPVLHRVAVVLKTVAIVGMALAGLVVLVLLLETWPPSLVSVLILLIVFGLLAACPLGLLGFTGSVQALSELPGIIANSPELYRQHSGEITRLYRDVGDPDTGRARGVGRGVIGGLKLVWRMRKDLPDVGGIVALARAGLFVFALAGVAMTGVNLLLLWIALVASAIHS